VALDRMEQILAAELAALTAAGAAKGPEVVIETILPAAGKFGPRFVLAGESDAACLRMNSNGYLGLAQRLEVIEAEEIAVRAFGTGPGAVRFIGGTWAPHVALEARLADFHGRPAAVVFSSAYAAVMGVLPPLITTETAVISDALNHNSIINAVRLAAPKEKRVYAHLDMDDLRRNLAEAAANCTRAIIVTDGIFSMRGDHARLNAIQELARAVDGEFAENVVVVVDDSHGVGAFGDTGRGTEEFTGGAADILLGTLGKAFGVNGGYVAASAVVIEYLREKSPFYIYSNPITPSEAAAAAAAIDVVDSAAGRALLEHLRAMTARFEAGLLELGLETIPGPHPVVPLMVRDMARTAALVKHLRENHILATGLNYPVVPKGDEEIRFQICADHTPGDIDQALAVLRAFEA
jgi:glycine C-acetyltransferase